MALSITKKYTRIALVFERFAEYTVNMSMKPKIIHSLRQTNAKCRKRWRVVSKTETNWFETYVEAEAYLKQISKPTELEISPL